jgi:hypothetical protein
MATRKLTLKIFHTVGRITFYSPVTQQLRCIYPEDISSREYGMMSEGQYARVQAHFEHHAGRLHSTNPDHLVNKWDLEHGSLDPRFTPKPSTPRLSWNAEVRILQAKEDAAHAKILDQCTSCSSKRTDHAIHQNAHAA